ncbi:MAG: hypothetical protein PSV35_10175 [bacterium]|nr:hypothetical protein [bacterium]
MSKINKLGLICIVLSFLITTLTFAGSPKSAPYGRQLLNNCNAGGVKADSLKKFNQMKQLKTLN